MDEEAARMRDRNAYKTIRYIEIGREQLLNPFQFTINNHHIISYLPVHKHCICCWTVWLRVLICDLKLSRWWRYRSTLLLESIIKSIERGPNFWKVCHRVHIRPQWSSYPALIQFSSHLTFVISILILYCHIMWALPIRLFLCDTLTKILSTKSLNNLGNRETY
jgi:hypothetical protein